MSPLAAINQYVFTLARYRKRDPGKLVDEPCQTFVDQYNKYGAKAFWKLLMEQGDKYTVRQYLAQQ